MEIPIGPPSNLGLKRRLLDPLRHSDLRCNVSEVDDHPRFSQIHPIMASGDQAIQALREAAHFSR